VYVSYLVHKVSKINATMRFNMTFVYRLSNFESTQAVPQPQFGLPMWQSLHMCVYL